MVTTFLLIPVLIIYYRSRTRKWFLVVVIALLLFYIRDLFMLTGFSNNPQPIIWTFAFALVILYLLAITSFKKAQVHPVEVISLIIMYGFLSFLYFTMADLIPQVIPSFTDLHLYLFIIINPTGSHYFYTIPFKISLWIIMDDACGSFLINVRTFSLLQALYYI